MTTEKPDTTVWMVRGNTGLTYNFHGIEDAIVPLETSLTLMQRLGGPVQAHFYNRSSHWTQVEHKDSFNTLIAEFFDGRI